MTQPPTNQNPAAEAELVAITTHGRADATEQAPVGSVYEQVEAVIERIRPAVQADGGDVELVEFTDAGIARIRLHGACIGCPSSSMTLHMGIERNLRERIPQVTAVEQVD